MYIDYFIDKFFQTGGVFGLLFGGALIVIFFLYKENRKLSQDAVEQVNRRVDDLKESRAAYLSASEGNNRIAENTYTIVQNLQQLLNNAKKI